MAVHWPAGRRARARRADRAHDGRRRGDRAAAGGRLCRRLRRRRHRAPGSSERVRRPDRFRLRAARRRAFDLEPGRGPGRRVHRRGRTGAFRSATGLRTTSRWSCAARGRARARSGTSPHRRPSLRTASSRWRSSRRAATGPRTRPTSTTRNAPGEVVLEEIYYFEIAPDAGGPGLGYHAGARDRGPAAGPARRGPRSRRRARPARLARPVHGGARLGHVLPQRHGRARRRPGVADHRRPCPRLGPRHLGRPGGRPAADRADERSEDP